MVVNRVLLVGLVRLSAEYHLHRYLEPQILDNDICVRTFPAEMAQWP